jgi:hypothetical protein
VFIIWGFGHNRTKDYGVVAEAYCERCHNNVSRNMLKVTSWFTIFFIPIIPYRTMYLLVCPICGQAEQLDKETFLDLSGQGVQYQDNPYAGKTETQVTFLKQMEEARQARENRGL